MKYSVAAASYKSAFISSLYLLVLSSLFVSQTAPASSFIVHIGPPSLGGGGPNPVSVPPSGKDFEFVYVTDNNREFSVGAVPGILYGIRSRAKFGGYVSAGGGILVNPGIIGLGVYTAFGYNTTCKSFCFNIEYKQGMGIYAGKTFSPYAVRAGMAYLF